VKWSSFIKLYACIYVNALYSSRSILFATNILIASDLFSSLSLEQNDRTSLSQFVSVMSIIIIKPWARRIIFFGIAFYFEAESHIFTFICSSEKGKVIILVTKSQLAPIIKSFYSPLGLSNVIADI
jgi:hypothetical protein